MTDTIASNTEFTEGRGGLRIPNVEFGEQTNPQHVVDFVRGLWTLNGVSHIGAERSAFEFGSPQYNQELVIPGDGQRPVTSLRYGYQPPPSQHDSAIETHQVLVPPVRIGVLQPYLRVIYRPRPSAGYVNQRDSLGVEHRFGGMELSVRSDTAGYNNLEQGQRRLLAAIMRDLVEFVS
jgi:hypothetical protein